MVLDKTEKLFRICSKVMFEKRPLWALIVGLNVCILIWLISVQEPVMFDVNTSSISSAGSSSNNFIINSAAAAAAKGGGGGGGVDGKGDVINGGVNSLGRDLLSHHKAPRQSNEYMDDVLLQGDDSTLTTLNMRNIRHNNNSYINSNLTIVTTTTTTATTTTTKTNDLSSDMQSLTSSLGTGTLAWQTKPTPSWSTIMTAAAASALPDEDFNHLIDLHDFQFLLPQPVCGNHIEALILIHSAPKNYEKRQVIRETWASITHHMIESPLRVLFLLGAVTSDELQQDLQNENNVYRDIVQGSFIDDYRNMTYKHIMAFKWFLYNCPQAQILIKVDDDVYVNTPQLIKYLKEQQLRTETDNGNLNDFKNKPTIATTKKTPNATTTTNTNNNNNSNNTSLAARATSIFQTLNIFSSLTQSASISTSTAADSEASSSSFAQFNASQELFNHPQNLLFCQKIIGSLVKRSYRSKWRVSFKEYSEHYYPPYCPGYAIIYSPDIIFRLYTAAQNSKYFWIDDVHITGVLAQKTNTTITTSSHYILYSDECDQILTGKTDLSKMEFLFAWHSISAQKIKLLWHLQMMSLQTLDDLQYKSKATSYNEVLYEKHQQQQQQQEKQLEKHKLKQKQMHRKDVENSITLSSSSSSLSSSVRHTSSNGLR